LRLLEHRLEVRFDRIEFDRELVLAEKDEEIAATVIREGTVGAVRWKWTCLVAGRPFLTFALNHRGATHLKGDWDFDDHWAITLRGSPGVSVEYRLLPEPGETPLDAAARMTAAVVIRSIPEVLAAPPGILQPRIFAVTQ
jgi:hypothetical protein